MPATVHQPHPRVIDPGHGTPRGVRLPDSWLRGLLAGAEGVLGTWLVVVVPAIAVYIATAAAPQLGAASWFEAARIGTGLWLAAHGAHLVVGEVTFTLLPAGLSLVAIALTAAALRRAALEAWAGVGLAAAAYAGGTVMLVQVAATPGGYRAVAGALVVVALAAAWGLRGRYPPAPPRWVAARTRAHARLEGWVASQRRGPGLRRAWGSLRAVLRAGAAASARLSLAIGALAATAVAAAVVLAFPLVTTVHARLDADAVSAVVLTGAQVLLAPTLIVWGAAYLSGAGFSLGAGTLYSPAEVVSAPLPALPVLGALPNPESPPLPALGYVYLVAGAFMGLYLHRRSRTGEGGSSLPAALAAAGAATAMTIGVFALLSALASGGFGPGRFAADVGPHTGAFLAALAWQCFAPAALIITCAHRATRRGAAAVVARACRLVRGQAPQ